MNENINLIKILKNCPKGTKLFSYIHGEVEFLKIDKDESRYKIVVIGKTKEGTEYTETFTAEGILNHRFNGICTLVPSKDQPDWSKWECPKPKFDPKTLKAFDKVLVRFDCGVWSATLFSHLIDSKFANKKYDIICCGTVFGYCIPYNDDTKHLVGTKDEAPEFYRYWED